MLLVRTARTGGGDDMREIWFAHICDQERAVQAVAATCRSESPRMTRAWRSRSACACIDIASSRAGGISTSLTSTEMTLTPQG